MSTLRVMVMTILLTSYWSLSFLYIPYLNMLIGDIKYIGIVAAPILFWFMRIPIGLFYFGRHYEITHGCMKSDNFSSYITLIKEFVYFPFEAYKFEKNRKIYFVSQIMDS